LELGRGWPGLYKFAAVLPETSSLRSNSSHRRQHRTKNAFPERSLIIRPHRVAVHLSSLLFAASISSAATIDAAQTAAVRTIPARTISTPTTVSPAMQKHIAPAWDGSTAAVSLTREQWKALIKETDEPKAKEAESLKEHLHVTVEEKTMAGVHVYLVTPDSIPEENRKRLLVHVHGGAYVFFGGMAATGEAILMAHYAKTEVLSIDYRMPPDFPFPAAIDDCVAVWKEVSKLHTPRNVGLFGSSTGGGMTLAIVIRLKELGLPLPGALMAGTPWSDLTKTGDTYFTNQFIDNVLGSDDGMLEAAAKLYAGMHDLKEPLISPVYGDLSGFPPTVLLSGTRDLFLSNTVRVHQKLLESGVDADLLVFEGQSHGQYLEADTPECAVALREVAQFFNRNLDR
jgi:acetyl esterase/lipase